MPAGLSRTLRRAARLPDDADPDGRLLGRFLADRDEGAFAELVRRHGPMVLGVCRRVTANHADADDAFQAAFLVLIRRAAGLLDRPTVGDFLYGVAYRTALKARVTAVKRRLKEARAARPEAAPAAVEEPAGLPELDRELARLPEKYRVAVVLCDLEGRPRKAVAGQLGIPEGTLSSRLAAGRQMLADRLRRHGLAAPVVGLTVTVSPALADATLDAAAVAAGHAAGAVPATVTKLTTEVSLTMLMSKLGVSAGVLAVSLAAGAAGLVVADPPAKTDAKPAAGVTRDGLLGKNRADQNGLKGTWELTKYTKDGVDVDPDDFQRRFEYKRLTFGDGTVRYEDKRHGTGDGKSLDREFRYAVNATARPPEMTIYNADNLLQCRYKLDGDTLTLGFLSMPGLVRAAGFEPADKPVDGLELFVEVYRRVNPSADEPTADPVAARKAVEKRFAAERAARDALAGAWVVKDQTQSGRKIPGLVGQVFTFGPRTARLGATDGEFTLTVNPAADPAEINLFKDGVLLMGVYQLDGDALRIAVRSRPEVERAKGFDGPGVLVWTLGRVKPAAGAGNGK